MLPDIKTIELFHLGPVPIHPFGLLVATGILAGRAFTIHRAKQAGIEPEEMDEAILYTVISAFLFAHLTEAVFYHPDQIARQGLIYLLKVWKGLSSFGGFFGGIFGFLFFVHRKKVRYPLLYAECILQGLVLGWIFGRLGCTIVFDHPGALSNFFLAFEQPGGARHNLGFYEFLFTLLILLPTILFLHGLKVSQGAYIVAVLILYTPMRFFMDFLRLDSAEPGGDMRYLGLTFAQYGCILLFILSLYLAIRLRKTPLPPPPPEPVLKTYRQRKK